MKDVIAPLYTAKSYFATIIKGRGDLNTINSALNHRFDNIERTSYEIIAHGIRSIYSTYKLIIKDYLNTELVEIHEGETSVNGLNLFFDQSVSLFEDLYNTLTEDDMKHNLPHPATKRDTEIHYILSSTIFHVIYHVGQSILVHQLAMEKLN